MKKNIFIILLMIICFGVPLELLSKVGVGIGLGLIDIEDALKPGMINDLPSVPVLNTGDEGSWYEMSIEYQNQNEISEMWPDRSWFIFEPDRFYLEPGQSQSVKMRLNIPIKTIPGDYFCYLEAHPAKTESEAGVTQVTIAAATKLYFTIAPANMLAGIYYRIASLFQQYAPWTWISLGIIFASIAVVYLRKHVSFEIGIKKK